MDHGLLWGEVVVLPPTKCSEPLAPLGVSAFLSKKVHAYSIFNLYVWLKNVILVL